jgi:hypothetical protein
LTIIHLTLNYKRIAILKSNGYMPRVWSKQVANIVVEHYGNVSFQDGVANIVFYSSKKHDVWNNHKSCRLEYVYAS